MTRWSLIDPDWFMMSLSELRMKKLKVCLVRIREATFGLHFIMGPSFASVQVDFLMIPSSTTWANALTNNNREGKNTNLLAPRELKFPFYPIMARCGKL